MRGKSRKDKGRRGAKQCKAKAPGSKAKASLFVEAREGKARVEPSQGKQSKANHGERRGKARRRKA
jgi:hypothetical protein